LRAEKLVLVRGEALPLALHRHLARREVDGQPAALEARLVAGLDAAQDGADARQQLARVERLGEIIVGAQLQPDDLVGIVAPRGHHDERRAPALADAPGESEAVHPGQHEIHQQDVEPARRQLLQGLPAVHRKGRGHAVLPEELLEQPGELAIVLDEQRADH
jgi:hypothetical protein